MNEIWLDLFVGLAVGTLLGAVFFGGLAWTVGKLCAGGRNELLFVLSFFLRNLLLVAGFIWIANAHWSRGVAALLGLLLARTQCIRLSETFPWEKNAQGKNKQDLSREKLRNGSKRKASNILETSRGIPIETVDDAVEITGENPGDIVTFARQERVRSQKEPAK